jgi:hypothetical protein
MTMAFHLEGPWLSTTGKKKGKVKFRNADEARRARLNKEHWEKLLKDHKVTAEDTKRRRALTSKPYVPPQPNYRGATDPKIPSLQTTGAPCLKAPNMVYTGDKMIGIGTMHKSNMVPIFSTEEATDISKMRRG